MILFFFQILMKSSEVLKNFDLKKKKYGIFFLKKIFLIISLIYLTHTKVLGREQKFVKKKNLKSIDFMREKVRKKKP